MNPQKRKLPVSRRSLLISDYKPGFIYEAWIGYEWIECEVGKNGISKQHWKDSIERGLVRPLNVKANVSCRFV